MIWIQNSILMRGELKVVAVTEGFRAIMKWPNDGPMESTGKTVQKAIERLELMLQDDCAQEMIDKGVV